LLIPRNEKEKLVLKLANEGKTTRDIAKEVHISLKDIGKIIRKAVGDSDPQEEDDKKTKEKEKRQKSLSPYAKAFQKFKYKNSLADVDIELDIKTDAVLDFYSDYLRLVRMHHLVVRYQDLKDDWPLFIHLYRRIMKEGLNKQDITYLLENLQALKFQEKDYNDFL
jgi:hypothetical protein